MVVALPTELEQKLEHLHQHAHAWVELPIRQKIEMLNRLEGATHTHAKEWVETAAGIKNLPLQSPLLSEEWLAGPWNVLRMVRHLKKSLAEIERHGHTRSVKFRTRKNGQVIADVFPISWMDRVLTSGIRAEVWMQPGVNARNFYAHTARQLRSPDHAGQVALVLGAGNVTSISVLDAIYKLFFDQQVVLLKLNPIMDPMQSVLEKVFAPLIEEGFLTLVTGSGEVGSLLTRHPLVHSVHITGAGSTHDRIVFGSGAEGQRRKQQQQPLLDKPITSELGAVTPTIVCPGHWTEADLQFQAEHVATQKLNNSGFNCLATQVLVLPEGWEHRDRFMQHLREAFKQAPVRPLYYPGAQERIQQVIKQHPRAVVLAGPRVLLENVDAAASHPLFEEEVFGPVLVQTTVPGKTPLAFLEQAIDFCNTRLFGTLSANILIPTEDLRLLGQQFEDQLARLKYGSIAVNAWSGLNYFLPGSTWGAHPGHTLQDIGSGLGVVHNANMFEKPEKSVVYGSFRPFPRGLQHGEPGLLPTPPWFVTHQRGTRIARDLLDFDVTRDPRLFFRIFFNALRPR